ncbi:TRAP transporter small permease [Gynuella sp.]|uniref:TRAP transporter small permease n=1 Tax=Gynuella sp. TaxID=2969146 RepID=UPI003D0DC63D
MRFIRRLGTLWNGVEDVMLVVSLSSMMMLSVIQILMRNFMETSLVWADPLIRILVLWIALLGAMIGTRKNQHIAIDLLSHYAPTSLQSLVARFIALIASMIAFVMAYFSWRFVMSEKEYETVAFLSVHAWIFQMLIPIAFASIALRFVSELIFGGRVTEE